MVNQTYKPQLQKKKEKNKHKMSKNNQFITKPILVNPELELISNDDEVSKKLKLFDDTMITEYNKISEYLNEFESKKCYTVVTCTHSIDKDISTNVVKLDTESCKILHERSPLTKILLIKQHIFPNNMENLQFKKVQLRIVKIPKPVKVSTVSKGKCVKRKKNIVK